MEEFVKSEALRVRLRPATLAALQQIAYDKEMRLSEYVRYALDRQIEQEQTDESD